MIALASLVAPLHEGPSRLGDADLLIAATALVYDLSLGTNNERHYNVIDGLPLTNWTQPA